ncbi:hypothetical protein L6E12_17820 [Actinokineospora sp. PR83]|uniref:hypothetical protein n=1 Tax=Actinokineospora sp. PR83 TaxID=2884908 RepID=UPI001F3515DB|nr:hypothetical protein [Actinokineospora sp. PR83]MCG8917644.1 hypothetical protein [Actinokineospora sp. PR83]
MPTVQKKLPTPGLSGVVATRVAPVIRPTLTAAALLLAASCSAGATPALPPPTSAPPAPVRTPVAGAVLPGAVAGLGLLDGAAVGTLAVRVPGEGELTSDVRGRCSPDATGTEVAVSSTGGAAVQVRLGGRSSLAVKDGELDFGADLRPGDYTVAAPRLRVTTGFGAAGRLELDVTCG